MLSLPSPSFCVVLSSFPSFERCCFLSLSCGWCCFSSFSFSVVAPVSSSFGWCCCLPLPFLVVLLLWSGAACLSLSFGAVLCRAVLRPNPFWCGASLFSQCASFLLVLFAPFIGVAVLLFPPFSVVRGCLPPPPWGGVAVPFFSYYNTTKIPQLKINQLKLNRIRTK